MPYTVDVLGGWRKQSRRSAAVNSAKFASLTKTTMPACPRFPPEISDHIVNILQDEDERETLK